MSTKIKRIPNVFEGLYLLARSENSDSLKWRDVLTGIHRKRKDKHSIKDMCLLYYSLFKAHTNAQISRLEIRYKDKRSRECLGPLTIKDIAESYLKNVSELIKYMNTKQLAIISKYLLLFNKLNESLCSEILLRISSNHLKITTRSFCNIVLSLSESSYVNSDSIQSLLIQNKNVLLNMNRIDLMYVLKSVSIHKINNKDVLNIITDKLNYYTQEMNSSEILSTLYSMYRLNWYNESVINKLYFKIQNYMNKYDVSSLILISKYLSHFNLRNVRDFFNMELMPLVHKLEDNRKLPCNSKMVDTNKESDGIEKTSRCRTDEVLLFYRNCFNSGSTVYPRLLSGILSDLTSDYQWQFLFEVLHKYQHNISCSPGFMRSIVADSGTGGSNNYLARGISTNDFYQTSCDDTELDEFVKLVLASIREFKSYIGINKVDIKYLPQITKFMVESGFDRNDVLLGIMRGIEEKDAKSTDYLVDVLYNLHTVFFDDFNDKYNKLIGLMVDSGKVCDYAYLTLITSILFYRNIEMPSSLVSMFRSAFDSGITQSGAWQIPSPEYTSVSSRQMRKIDLCDEALEYLLHAMVFPVEISSKTTHGNAVNGSEGTGKNNIFLDYKREIVCILKTIREFERCDLIIVLLYCIGKVDIKFLERILDAESMSGIRSQYDASRLVNDSIKLELVESATIPIEGKLNLNLDSCLLIKLNEELLFKPCYLASGTKEVYCSKPSRNKWDSLSINILRSVLELNSYSLYLI